MMWILCRLWRFSILRPAMPLSKQPNLSRRCSDDEDYNPDVESGNRWSPGSAKGAARARRTNAMTPAAAVSTLRGPRWAEPDADRHFPAYADRTGHRTIVTMADRGASARSEEHPSELPSLMRISYADFC